MSLKCNSWTNAIIVLMLAHSFTLLKEIAGSRVVNSDILCL